MDHDHRDFAIILAYKYALDEQVNDYPPIDVEEQFDAAATYAVECWSDWIPEVKKFYSLPQFTMQLLLMTDTSYEAMFGAVQCNPGW